MLKESREFPAMILAQNRGYFNRIEEKMQYTSRLMKVSLSWNFKHGRILMHLLSEDSHSNCCYFYKTYSSYIQYDTQIWYKLFEVVITITILWHNLLLFKIIKDPSPKYYVSLLSTTVSYLCSIQVCFYSAPNQQDIILLSL